MADEQLISRAQLFAWIRRQRELIIVVLTSAVSLIAMQYYVKSGVFGGQITGLVGASGWSDDLNRLVRWATGCVGCYLLLPVGVLLLLGRSPRTYGLNVDGLTRHWKTYALLFLPVGLGVALASGLPGFQSSYPFLHQPLDWRELLIWELCYTSQFFALEFFFRGFMVHGLRPHLGSTGAVLVMLLPYVMIHFGKPFLETCGALIAGAILGFLSLRTGSIAGGAILHILVAVEMDLLALLRKGWF